MPYIFFRVGLCTAEVASHPFDAIPSYAIKNEQGRDSYLSRLRDGLKEAKSGVPGPRAKRVQDHLVNMCGFDAEAAMPSFLAGVVAGSVIMGTLGPSIAALKEEVANDFSGSFERLDLLPERLSAIDAEFIARCCQLAGDICG